MKTPTTLIIGIGNTLLTDEGAGIFALNAIESRYRDMPEYTFIDGGTLSFSLAGWISDTDNLILLDAAELKQPAGTVRVMENEALDDFLGKAKRTAHEVGLLDLMDIARLTESLPEKRALIGVQPESLEWGTEATPAVQSAIAVIEDEFDALIKRWNLPQAQSIQTQPLSVNL